MMQAYRPYRAVLTGAAGGIGSALAKALMPHADYLILVGRNRAALDTLRAQLDAARVHLVDGDLTDPATLDAITNLTTQLGGFNLLINNAGSNDFHAFETQSEDAIRNMIEINLLAPMLLSRRLIPLMKKQLRAQIVNIGSVMGSIGFPGFSVYCGTKSGLQGFTQALRRELADTVIDVRYFAPRATRTSINSDAANAMNRELRTEEDTPEAVAKSFMTFLNSGKREQTLGAKESFFVLLNKVLPGLPERAIRGQLPIIRKHLPD